MRKFFKTIPTKLYILLFAVVTLSFFSNDFGLVDIQKTAIILAIGVDKKEEGFHVTAQISVPKGDRTTGGTSSIEIGSSGVTVADCILHIYTKTGWVPKFVFCDLILLGEDVAKDNAMPVLEYFLRNDYMPDDCTVAVCKGNAEEVISSQSAIDDTSSQAILKLFSGVTEQTGTTVNNTLKDFSISAMSVSKSGYMPYITAVPQNEGASGGSGGSGGGSQGGSGEQAEQNQKFVYSADQTALFSEGKMVGLLNSEETFAYNLLQGKVVVGTVIVKNGEQSVTLSVVDNKGDVSLNPKGKPSVDLKTEIRLQLFDRQSPSPIEDVAGNTPGEKDLAQAQELVRSYVQSLWDTCQESGCDLFLLRRSLQRSSPKLFEEWQDRFPQALEVNITVTAKSVK